MLNLQRSELNYISREELYGILETMPVPIILTESDKTVRFANNEALKLGNYDALAGKKCYETFCRKTICNCPVSAEGKIKNSQQKFFTATGETIPVNKQAQPVHFNDDLFFAQFFTDLSSQIQKEEELKLVIAEKELAKQKAQGETSKFEQLFEGVGEAIILHDFEGNIIKTNQSANERLGYTSEEFRSLKIRELVEPGLQAKSRERILKVKQTGQAVFESIHLSKKGEKFPVEVSANTVCFDGKKVILGVARDITVRKRIEAELLQAKQIAEHNEAELKTIFNKVPSTILIFDEDTRIKRINQKGSNKFKISGNKAKGKRIGEILNCANLHLKKSTCSATGKCSSCALLSNINSTINNGTEVNKKEVALKLLNNGNVAEHTILLSTAILEGNGKKTYIATIDDITDRKKMENDLVLAKEKAELSEKLKSAFLNNISHEIRTPLNGLLGFLDFFEEGIEEISTEDRRLFIHTMRKSGDRLMQTVEDIVETSKLDSGIVDIKNEPIPLKKVEEELKKYVLQKFAETEVKFNCNIPSELIHTVILTDESKLIRVLKNLLGNAFKFTRKGRVNFEVTEQDNQLIFSVTDTGIGIEEKDLNVIFEPFRQADINLNRAFDGNGLGLTIAQKMVKLLGSELVTESEKGKGSRFSFALPKINNNAADGFVGQALNTNVGDVAFSGKKILVAEDDETNYLFLKAVLEKEGCNLMRAVNGKEAVELFRQNKNIDLIIMDLKMPVMNGIEATLKIKAIDNAVPIIAHSAYVLNNEKEQSLAAGCSGYISKPVKKDELINVIKRHIAVN